MYALAPDQLIFTSPSYDSLSHLPRHRGLCNGRWLLPLRPDAGDLVPAMKKDINDKIIEICSGSLVLVGHGEMNPKQ